MQHEGDEALIRQHRDKYSTIGKAQLLA